MDPLSIPVALITILMRRAIDSFYKAPTSKNLTVSTNYSTYTYTVLIAALWFFYNQFTKRGLRCPSKPLLAIKENSTPNISSDHLVQCKSAEETNMQLIQRNDDAQLQELYRQRKCVHVIVKNETEIKSAGNNFAALCASHIRNQLFSRHFNNRENSPSSSSGEMFAPRLKKRKFRRLTRSWKFDGEPIAKKTRSGHIYGYVNQIAP